MKKAKSILMLSTMAIFLLSGVAIADWVPADGHKMHWAQEPDPNGDDVMGSEPVILADDFECAETGWIQDIHFWGSWMGGYDPDYSILYGFIISIHEDIPADDPMNPYGYSMPGAALLEKFFTIDSFTVSLPFSGEQGWLDPCVGYYNPSDHYEYFQYNLFLDEDDWVHQDEGNIYWLNICAVVLDPSGHPWGWKTTYDEPSGLDLRFMDTSVWASQEVYPYQWAPIYQPVGPPWEDHLDLAFVITGEPEEEGACCYPEPTGGPNTQCIVTTQYDCENNLLGVYEEDGTLCLGTEACCVQGTCVDADALCCLNELGGTPQGVGTACPGTSIACCLQGDPDCQTVDQPCCDDIGGTESPIGAPACLGDGNSNGTDDACETGEPILKWLQPPDLEPTGMDVSAYYYPPDFGFLLADDFLCTTTGPLLKIHIWGSWFHDWYPFQEPVPQSVWFTLSIHTDIPANQNPYGDYSMPGELLWLLPHRPADEVNLYSEGIEGWFEPPQFYTPDGDARCWEYVFYIDPVEAFIQFGTTEEPITYWLDVQAYTEDYDAHFGWKTSTAHWNDDAAWIMGIEPELPIGSQGIPEWWELRYPPGHPWAQESIDLAFALYGDTPPTFCQEYKDRYDCCVDLRDVQGRNVDPVACWALTKSGSTACNSAGCNWDAGKGMCLIDICLGDTNMDTFVAGGDSAQVDRDYGRTDCPCDASGDLCEKYDDMYDCCLGLAAAGRNLDPVACWALTKSGSAACNGANCYWDAGKGMCLIDICLGDTNMDTFVAGGDSAQVDRDYGRTDCLCPPPSP